MKKREINIVDDKICTAWNKVNISKKEKEEERSHNTITLYNFFFVESLTNS